MTHIEQMIKDLCPHGVEWKTLGEVCNIETGKLNANAAVEGGQYPFFTTSKEISYINDYKWDTEALLIAGNANIGDVKHYIGKFNAYQRTYVLTNFKEELVVRFLYHYTKARLKDFLDDKKNEAAMSYIVLSSLQAFPIPIPPLEIQKKIVECLDKFSALAAELQAELQKRRTQYEYYRTQLLTPPPTESTADNNDGCNWEWKTTKDLTLDSFWLMPATPHFIDSGIPYITSKNIKQGSIDFNECKYISEEDFDTISSTRNLQKDDLLITMIGTIGEAAFIKEASPFYGQNIYVVRLNQQKINLKYFYYYFTSPLVRDSLVSKKNASSQGYIKAGNIEKLAIPIPSLAEQERIVGILDKFESLTTSLSDGIPAEQIAQQKRYEYYRDLLLTFDRKAV